MPNTGRPSKDCHACRKRRVKCGLEQPECARCIKLGVRCPGYREESSVMFRNEDMVSLADSVASKNRKRAKQTTSNETQDTNDSSTSQEAVESTQIVTDDVLQQLAEMDAIFIEGRAFQPLQHGTLTHWQEKSPLVILSLFSARKDEYRIFGLASFLPHMIFEADSDSGIRLCCQALTLALLANKTATQEAFQLRDEAYGRALQAIHAAIADTATRQDDGTAISVWLLGVYELVATSLTPTARPKTITWKFHVGGLTQLLRARGIEQLQTEQGMKIFWLLTSFIQIRSLTLLEDDDLDYVRTLIDTLQQSGQVRVAELVSLAKYTNETISMVSTINSALAEADTNYDPTKLRRILVDAIKLEAHLVESVIENIPKSLSHPFEVYVNNQYRGCYIRMLQLTLDLTYTIQNKEFQAADDVLLNAVQEKSLTAIQSQVKLIFDTLPFILGPNFDSHDADTGKEKPPTSDRLVGWSDVLRLLWPLRTISTRPQYITEDQAAYLWRVEQYVSTTYGIGTQS